MQYKSGNERETLNNHKRSSEPTSGHETKL